MLRSIPQFSGIALPPQIVRRVYPKASIATSRIRSRVKRLCHGVVAGPRPSRLDASLYVNEYKAAPARSPADSSQSCVSEDPMRRIAAALPGAVLGAILMLGAAVEARAEVVVYAAASTTDALNEIGAAFAAKNL